MIISHKHKFIFIKTEKTAGTSLEIALSKICGPNDIIAPIASKDEDYRKELGHRTKQNYHVPFSKYAVSDIFYTLRDRQLRFFFNHIPARLIIRYLGRKKWDEYFKFTFERNPFDKLISYYYWRGGESKFPTVMDFINSGIPAKVKGFDLYTLNSKVAVDQVYKFEELDSALKDISKRLNLEETLAMPEKKAKGNVRKKDSSYQSILTLEERQWVEKTFARELKLFNYSY